MVDNDEMGVTAESSGSPGAEAFGFAGLPFPEVFTLPDLPRREAQLAVVIEREIVPRLILYHAADGAGGRGKGVFTSDEIAELGKLTMGPDIDAAKAYFEKIRERGHSLETLFVHFLGPTARYLGELWCDDRCDFVDVTIGVARLQQLMAMFGAAAEIPVVDLRRKALMFSTAGEKHLFGVDLVTRAMRSAGWDVTVSNGHTAEENTALVSSEWFGVVGVTLSAEAGIRDLARTIAAMRKVSVNPRVGFMVGGPVFTHNPDIAIQIGADAVAEDAIAAVILAKKLLLSQFEGWS